MLDALPDKPESLYSRIELLYELGYLFWTLGDTHKSKDSLIAGMGLARGNEFSNIRLRILNGLAIIYYEMEEYLKADEIYENIMESDPQEGLFWINLSAILCALGKNYSAASQGKKATKIEPANAKIWNSFGYINLSMGKLDEAVACFKKAIELAPTKAAFHESLAVCFSRMGLIDEALDQINSVRKLTGNQSLYSEIYEEVILGRSERALNLLRVAVETGQIPKVDIRHDPNINLILDRSII
jgi:tetratricopeptide (TPR) repeat protein